MKYLREPLTHGKIAGIVSSIRRSLKGIDEIWKMCRNKYPLFKYPYHGLNWVLTDGKILVAMCYVNPGGFGKAKALCDRSEPYYQLHYRRDPNGWTVASETLDDDPRWKRMHHGDVLIADTKRGSFLKCS